MPTAWEQAHGRRQAREDAYQDALLAYTVRATQPGASAEGRAGLFDVARLFYQTIHETIRHSKDVPFEEEVFLSSYHTPPAK